MLDAVTFNLGNASMPTFSLPDTSGLAPLVLPMEFLHSQQHQQTEPSTDAVSRFEAAMSVEPRFPKSTVVNLIGRTISEVPVAVDQSESQKVESPKAENREVESPTAVNQEVESQKVESLKSGSRESVAVKVPFVPQTVRLVPEADVAYTFSTPIEKPAIVTGKPVTIVAKPVAVETSVAIGKQESQEVGSQKVEGIKPEIATVGKTQEKIVADSAHVVVMPLAVEVPVAPQAVRPVPESGVAYTVSSPIEKPAIVVGKPVTTVAKPVTIEPPVAIDKPGVVMGHAVVVDKPVVVEGPVAVDKPIVVEGPVSVDKPVAVEGPVAVDKSVGASIEKLDVPSMASVVIAHPVNPVNPVDKTEPSVESLKSESRGPVMVEVPSMPQTVRPAPDAGVTHTVFTPIDEATIVAEKPVTIVAKPVAVETPVVIDKPESQKVESQEVEDVRPEIVTVGETQERVVTDSAHVVVTPAAVEVPSMPRAVRPVSEASVAHPASTPIEKPTIVVEKPVAMVATPETVEPPVAIDKPVVVVGTAVAVDKPVVVEGPVAIDKPVRVSIEKPYASVIAPVVIAHPVNPVNPVDKTELSVESLKSGSRGPVMVEVPSMPQTVRPVSETAVAYTVSTPIEKTAIVVEKPVTIVATSETIEPPVAIDKPSVVLGTAVAAVDKPVVVEGPVAIDKPVRVSIEKPDASVIAPVVIAHPVNPVNPVDKTEPSVESLKSGSRGPVMVEVPSMPQTVRPVPETDVAHTASIQIENPTIVVEKPVATVANPVTVETPVVTDKPVAVDKPVGASIEKLDVPSIASVVTTHPVKPVNPVDKAELSVESRKSVSQKVESQEAGAAAHSVVIPMAVDSPSVPQTVQAMPEVTAVSSASARTEAIVETVNQIVEAVVGQILVTPGIVHGECEIKITLKPTVLDGSEITMSAKDGTLAVSIAPTTQAASAAATAALPRLETALAEHVSAFHHVSVALVLKKGSRNETV